MTLYKKVGSKGSISLHYKGIMCSIFPLTNEKNEDYYVKMGNDGIIRHLKDGYGIEKQIKILTSYCELFVSRRYHKQKVSKIDHIIFCQALMGLIKLKQIENDDKNGWLCLKKSKKKKNISST